MTRQIREKVEYRVLKAYAAGQDLHRISEALDVPHGRVSLIVQDIARFNRAGARTLVADWERAQGRVAPPALRRVAPPVFSPPAAAPAAPTVEPVPERVPEAAVSGEWRLLAECASWPPDAPYAPEGSPEEDVFIRKACGKCPVRKACLEWALQLDDPGVIGGLNQTQRRAVQQEQARRRPKPAQWRRSGCGTGGGYFRHRRAGEKPCDACRAAHSARDAANARRRAGERLVPRTPPEDTGACGTGKGYQRHHARGQEACGPCTVAKTEQSRQHKTKAG